MLRPTSPDETIMFATGAKSKGYAMVDTSRDIFLRHEHQVAVSYAGLRHASFGALGCTFEGCDFSNMRPDSISFASGREPTQYRQCRFDGSRFKKVIAGQARFEKCTFLDVDIRGLFAHSAEFIDCVFSGVLRTSVFFGRVFGNDQKDVPRTVNEFRGNDFSAMKFIDVGFRQGIDLSLQRLPEGDGYLYLRNAGQKLASFRQKYTQQPPSKRRQEVFEFLKRPEEEVRDGQVDLFMCKDSEPLLSRDAVDAIWDELR